MESGDDTAINAAAVEIPVEENLRVVRDGRQGHRGRLRRAEDRDAENSHPACLCRAAE